ncbi:MAG: isopeptide-forming domain-containing fimbrial protein [Oscillospiraceae bacterium]|nr:isopeptide-forming domain-containing fimbrial protein [Oscillospiraceae bacterium]
MNRMKKFASIMLALVMAFALMAPAFASTGGETTDPGENPPPAATNSQPTEATGPFDITITNATKDHTYEAYQIFSGKLSNNLNPEEGKTKYILSEIEWGTNVNQSALSEALSKVPGLEGLTEAADVADRLANGYETGEGDNKQQHTVSAEAFAQAIKTALTGSPAGSVEATTDTAKLTVSGAGYYLVKDRVDKAENADDAITLFMLQVVGPTEVKAKVGKPTPDKKILEDSKEEVIGDYYIGQEITFQLKATLGNGYENYKTYELVFNDTMSKGLDFVKITSVTVDGTTATEGSYTVADPTKNSDGGTILKITFANLKEYYPNLATGNEIIITYTAKLNNDAKIGNPGNPNKMNLEFSNNPNDDGNGEKGKTPDKEVLIFTFELDNNKVDGQDTSLKLKGAEFKLRNNNEGDENYNKWVTVSTDGKVTGWVDTEEGGSPLISDDKGLFKVIGLEAGNYALKETKAPTGYNKLEDEIPVVITPTYDEKYDGTPDVTTAPITDLSVTVGGKDAAIDDDKGIGTGTIANNKGATLPETGGIGTTIFYAVGGLLTVGAVVLLVTKKRMNADDK